MGRRRKVFNKISLFACMIFVINLLTLNFSLKIEEAHAAVTRSSELMMNPTRPISFDMSIQDKVYTKFDFSKYIGDTDKITKLTIKNGSKTINGEIVKDANKQDSKIWKAKFVAIHGQEFELQVEANISGHNQKMIFKTLYEDTDLYFKPTMAINGKNIECDLKEWASRYSNNDKVDIEIYTGSKKIVPETSKFISDLKSNKVIFDNKSSSLEENTGYILKAVRNGKTYSYKFFCDKTGEGQKKNLVFKNQEAKLISATIRDNKNLDLEVQADTVKNHSNVVLKISANGTPSTNSNTLDKTKKIGKFENFDTQLNKKINTRVEYGSNGTSESMFNLHVLEKFQKLDCEVKPLDITNSGLSIKLGDMSDFLSKTPASNKITIYEVTDFNSKKKIGEKSGNLNVTSYNDIDFTGDTKLAKDKTYLIELTNGTKTISTSFVFLPIGASHKNVEYTEAKVGWSYPVGYVPVSGDKIEIFIRDKDQNQDYPGTPKVTLTHSNGTNLSNLTETTVKDLSPGTNYEAKVALSKQGVTSNSITSFKTKDFTLKKFIDVDKALYGGSVYKVAHPRNRKIKVMWDYEPENMTFGKDDKVEILIKPIGAVAFENYPKDDKYRNPYFEEINGASNKLQGLKSAELTIPSYFDFYHVDLIYTIGGKKIINYKKESEEGEAAYNRRAVQISVTDPDIEVTDITKTSAKITWDYDHGFNVLGEIDATPYIPEDGQRVKGSLKKVNSMTDMTTGNFNQDIFDYEHGKDNVNLLEKKEYDLTGLEPDQCYRLRIQHIVQNKDFDGNYRTAESFYNFKTSSFSVSNLKAEIDGTDSRKINLTWDTNGDPVFDEGGTVENSVKVFLKEANTSEYPENPLTMKVEDAVRTREEEESQQPTEEVKKKKCTIEIPKYNTQYNAKLQYNLKGGKKIEEFVLIKSDIDMTITVSGISGSSSNCTATVNCNLPSGYVKKNNDKIQLTVTEVGEKQKTLPSNKDLTIETNKASENLSSLTENKTYNITAKFLNDTDKVVETSTASFKATTDFQVIDMKVSDIKATTAKLTWDYTPSGKLSSLSDDNDKVEILMKVNSPEKSKRSSDPDDALTDWTTVLTLTQSSSTTNIPEHITKTVDLQEVLSIPVNAISTRDGDSTHSKAENYKTQNLKDLKSINLTGLKVGKDYSIKVKYNISSALNGDSNAVKEAEVSFKTVAEEFKSTVFVSNQTSATFGWEYPAGYTIQKGDKVEIFIKEEKTEEQKSNSKNTNDWGEALLTLTHEGDIDLNSITAVDVSGLTPERKYKGKISFTMGKDAGAYTISSEVDISTHPFEIKSFELDSYQEYDILVKWEIEPKNMVFNPADKLEMFVKLKSEKDYPTTPDYKLTMDPADGDEEQRTIQNTFSDYVLAKTLGEPQNIKMVYTVGERTYEKELEFTNTINPMKAEVSSVDETRALIEITTPDNYEFVNGDKLLVYAKDEFSESDEIEIEDFLVFEGIQADDLSIPDDMQLIELSYLLPEANYNVRVKLDLLDGTVQPVDLEFRTEALPVTDPKLESIAYNSSVISWDYGENAIDFFEDEGSYEFTDKLIIAHKENDGTPIPADINILKQMKHKEYLGDDIKTVKDATIEVEDPSKEYEVAVCYDLGGLLYMKNTKASFLSLKTDEESITSTGVKLNWKYPINVQFLDADKTEIFVRKSSDSEFPAESSFSSTGTSTTSTTLENLEGGVEYVAKVQITKEGLKIDPVEVTFTTKGAFGEETIVEEIPEEISGTEATIQIPPELPVNTSEEPQVVMGDESYSGFSISFSDDGTGFTITPTIPKKTYTNIQVTLPLEDGSTHTIVIPELVTQPADTAQDWLSNAYWFAFERFPDEGGYNYWYADRMKTKTLNGEYFLKNLMFAEDEFTNRNLSDQDLIASLYQIVVNREYDQGGLDFWIGIYNENLQNAAGNKKLAQEVLVDRMVHEAEFGKLCDNVGIFWTQQDQDAAGVPS